jgi:hypothetical protein
MRGLRHDLVEVLPLEDQELRRGLHDRGVQASLARQDAHLAQDVPPAPEPRRAVALAGFFQPDPPRHHQIQGVRFLSRVEDDRAFGEGQGLHLFREEFKVLLQDRGEERDLAEKEKEIGRDGHAYR